VAGPPRRRRDPKLQRFLLDGERVVVDVRQHWFVIAGPVAWTLIALFVVMWVDARVRVDAGAIARVLWFAWFILLAWMGFQIAQWRHDRFIATNKRLLMDYGLITQKIAMMPFIKVTDMSYRRTIPGRIFGYGEFILESAGQDQALRKVEWVPHPDTTYRIICAEIFGLPNQQRVADPDRDDGFIDDDPGGSAVSRALRMVNPLGGRTGGGSRSAAAGTTGKTQTRTANRSPIEEHLSHSRAIPLHQRGAPASDPRGEILYSSDDERRRRQTADTGPLPTPPERDPAADD
jgi:membrane protein YdbS with pleckstrin-like domain